MLSDKMRRILIALDGHAGWGSLEEIKRWLGYNDGRKVSRALYFLKRRGLVTDNWSDFSGIDQDALENYEYFIYVTGNSHIYALTHDGVKLAKEVRHVHNT
jgi:predicted DNA-binding ArsR family transcriptional regulator